MNAIETTLHYYYFDISDPEQAKEYNPDKSKDCGKGLHVSTPFYWDGGNALISVTVDIKDVITCLDGKLRVKKLFVNGKVR